MRKAQTLPPLARNTDSTQGDCAVVLCAQQKPNKNKERTAVARRGIRDVPLLPKAPFLDTSGCCRRRYWDIAAAHFTRNFPVPRKVPTLFPTHRWQSPLDDDVHEMMTWVVNNEQTLSTLAASSNRFDVLCARFSQLMKISKNDGKLLQKKAFGIWNDDNDSENNQICE